MLPQVLFSSTGDVNGRRQFLNDDSVEKVTEWCHERKSFTWGCHHQAALINSENT